MAPRYIHSWPDGTVRFYVDGRVIYAMNGRAEFYIDGQCVYSHHVGKPVYWISDNHLFAHGNSGRGEPSLYFGEFDVE